MCPVAQADGHDAPRLVDEFVPGVAAVIDDVALGVEDAVGQPVVSHELPDVLDRVELGAFGWQRHECDVRRYFEPVRKMPSGLIEQQHGVSPRRHCGRHLGQVQVHRRDIAVRQHEGGALAVLGADRAEDVGRGGALILRRRGSAAAFGPASGDLVLLADPGFVGKPDLYRCRLDPLFARDLAQQVGDFFLKSSTAPAACA